MENESDMIRRQMSDTRTALSDKLELLERKVAVTVSGASMAVTKTVESVKGMVQETVQIVGNSMKESVDAVKNTIDLKRHADKRPWTMVGAAAALGLFSNFLLRGRRTRHCSTPLATCVRASEARNGVHEFRHSVTRDTRNRSDAAHSPATDESSRFANLGNAFEAEISQLKGLAVATLLGIVRDIATNAVPKPMENQVADVFDGITVKLGGKPIRGRLLPDKSESEESDNQSNQNDNGHRGQSNAPDLPNAVAKRLKPDVASSS